MSHDDDTDTPEEKAYLEAIKPYQQLHRTALKQACERLQMNLTEYGRMIGIKDRQIIHRWNKDGRIPTEYVLRVATDAKMDAKRLIGYPRKPYTHKTQ